MLASPVAGSTSRMRVVCSLVLRAIVEVRGADGISLSCNTVSYGRPGLELFGYCNTDVSGICINRLRF
jgi:hypothetical protein